MMRQHGDTVARPAAKPDRLHMTGHAATLALALVLACLAGFAFWAALATNQVAGRARHASELSDEYQQARYAVGAEESLERKYRLEPGAAIHARHRAAAAVLVTALERVDRDGDAADRAIAAEVLATHTRYLAAIERMFAAVDDGDTARVNAIDGDEVDPLFGAIEARVDAAADARHAAALEQLDALTRTERLVFLLTPLVFAVGLALVGLLWGYLRQYQRRVDDATRREAARLVEVNGTLARQAAALAAANEELRRKNEENEAFVYSVSHDLRSPLVNLQGFSQELALTGAELRTLLADPGVPPGVRARGLAMLDEDLAPALGFIQTGVRRLSGIIDALLRLSRVGEVVYRREPVDPTPLVARIVASLNETVAGPRATIAVGALPPLCGDPSAVEQIFGNLIGNALKYLDPHRPGRIEVGCLAEGDADADAGSAGVRTYYVRDNGLGIPPPRPGPGLPALPTPPPAGRGGGRARPDLRAARRRATRGTPPGRVGPGGGQHLLRDPAYGPGGRHRAGAGGGGRRGGLCRERGCPPMITLPLTIILAEDDPGHAALVQRNLRRAAITNDLIHVRDGQALLDYLRGVGAYAGRDVPDAPLILLDLNMPGLGGVETLAILKADADTQPIPVIMLSTADNPREIAACYELGCNMYLTKPVEYEDFAAAIRQLGLFLQFVRVPTHHDGGGGGR